ncbi:hypothetical protein AVEN_93974-1 [Araneus ventricosus]|uniref:Uncharacterized protein n=1 Tax=Araneus ventricosus TaxID=182803 RepID=A0A4Y2CJQ0_ARAVE|nr:hypothetical protein AVEN_93974-1 [Araneus ventricosus]
MEEHQEGTKYGPYTTFPSKYFQQPTLTVQMRLKLEKTTLAIYRYGVSNRAIASSIIQVLGLILESDTSLVADKNKIWREKSIINTELVWKSKENRSILSGLYFDGRRNKTFTTEILENKQLQRTIVDEYHSIVSESGSTFLWHITPESGSSFDISNSIYEYVTTTSSRYLFNKYGDIIEKVISRNAYFTAPENMLLAMLTGERYHIRTLAARRIIMAREIRTDGNCVRRFVIPAVKRGSIDYEDLIDWQACYVTRLQFSNKSVLINF